MHFYVTNQSILDCQIEILNFIHDNYVVPAHQTSDMSRCTILPKSRSKLEMVILSSLHFLTI